MRHRRAVAAGMALAFGSTLLAPAAGAQQRATDEKGEVPFVVQPDGREPVYVPLPWEITGLALPLLSDDAVVATSEDDDQLVFVNGTELGTFRPAPEGGTPFFGAGQPIFGLAAPPVLPTRVLRPLGSGDTGDRFLGSRPEVDPTTVIPKLDETFDARRESFAFLDGVPPLPDPTPEGSTAFPLPEQVEADDTPGVLDNLPRPGLDPTGPLDPPGPPSTTPPEVEPGPPGSTPPGSTPRPTTSTPATVPVGTTVPPTTSTTRGPTTTTSSTTTSTSTTSTTSTSTTTTSTTTTSTTTTTIPGGGGGGGNPPVMFVLGNQREAADFCLSNGSGGNVNACDRVFDFSAPGSAAARPGGMHFYDLTLWNVDPDSNTNAVALKLFSETACSSGTVGAGPWGTGNLCNAAQVWIQRYDGATRATRTSCVYGATSDGGTTCEWSSSHTLASMTTSHSSWASAASVDTDFRVNDKVYLRIGLRLPDSGVDASGRGLDNPYMNRSATISMTWRMESA